MANIKNCIKFGLMAVVFVLLSISAFIASFRDCNVVTDFLIGDDLDSGDYTFFHDFDVFNFDSGLYITYQIILIVIVLPVIIDAIRKHKNPQFQTGCLEKLFLYYSVLGYIPVAYLILERAYGNYMDYFLEVFIYLNIGVYLVLLAIWLIYRIVNWNKDMKRLEIENQ